MTERISLKNIFLYMGLTAGIYIHHFLRIQQRRRAVRCIDEQLACVDHDTCLLLRERDDRRMHMHGVGC